MATTIQASRARTLTRAKAKRCKCQHQDNPEGIRWELNHRAYAKFAAEKRRLARVAAVEGGAS